MRTPRQVEIQVDRVRILDEIAAVGVQRDHGLVGVVVEAVHVTEAGAHGAERARLEALVGGLARGVRAVGRLAAVVADDVRRALVDTDGAPRRVAVDHGALAGKPHEGQQREAALGVGVELVLLVPGGIRHPLPVEQQVVVYEDLAERGRHVLRHVMQVVLREDRTDLVGPGLDGRVASLGQAVAFIGAWAGGVSARRGYVGHGHRSRTALPAYRVGAPGGNVGRERVAQRR